jgi:vancomycin resistance protein YoaR
MTRAMTAEPLSNPAIDEAQLPLMHPHRIRTRFLLAFVIGLFAVLAVGVGALYAYDQRYLGRILPGVHVGEVDVSGLTPDEAATRLSAAYGDYGKGQVVVAAGDRRFSMTYAQFGRQADIPALVTQAMTVGRAGNPVERVIANARTAFRGVVIEPRVRIDEDALTQWAANVAASQHRSPTDATINRTKKSFTVTESALGRDADPTGVASTLLDALHRTDAPAVVSVDLPFTDIQPTVTTDDAAATAAAANRIAQNVVIRQASDQWTIPASTIRGWISFQPAGDAGFVPVVDTSKIDKALGKVANAVARPARNASLRVVGGRVVVSGPASNGRALDRKATAARVAALLAARATPGTSGDVDAVLRVIAPSLSTAAAHAAAPKMRAISSWTTYFFITERNHFGANIWIPALDIDGTVVGPGETFDFWNAIGPISRAHGYGDGGAIINGKTEPQGALAGGICSNSTTLFNAVLRAGYQMGARRNHYYYIDRYPIGLDATVFKSSSGSTQTMSWTNDTKYPVLIRGFKIRANGKGYVKYVIYSVPTHRKIVIGPPTIHNVRPAWDTTVRTSSLPAGVYQRVEFPVDGKDVWRTVTVYQNRKIIHQTTYYSHYSRVTGVTLVGTR